eukprot:SAG22_NODE_181_length_16048_cov_157.464418_12_plen_146_part_00
MLPKSDIVTCAATTPDMDLTKSPVLPGVTFVGGFQSRCSYLRPYMFTTCVEGVFKTDWILDADSRIWLRMISQCLLEDSRYSLSLQAVSRLDREGTRSCTSRRPYLGARIGGNRQDRGRGSDPVRSTILCRETRIAEADSGVHRR